MHFTFRATLLIAVIAAGLAMGPVWAQRGDDSKRLSKNGKTEATIGGVDVSIEYGRPSVKDRVIWGGLVPYDRVWRTGADEATTISFSDDVRIGDEELAAGQYSLFTIPGESEWTVIFNRVAQQWGAFNYDETQDALRVTVETRPCDFVETFEITIEDSEVILSWAELAVPFTIAPGAAGD